VLLVCTTLVRRSRPDLDSLRGIIFVGEAVFLMLEP
jgi:hypothetical protein